jgi:hypothetical protein
MPVARCQADLMSDEQWYFCLKHHTVEGPDGCRAADRLGPYPDKETASRALEIARERTEAADEADRDWDERGTGRRGGAEA